ncbi:hypothetical protein SMICM17S_00360 [Streptomyces microflavus]
MSSFSADFMPEYQLPPYPLPCLVAVSHIFISSMSSRIFCASSPSLAKIQVSPFVILMPPPMSMSALPSFPSFTPGVLAVTPAEAASVNVMGVRPCRSRRPCRPR